MAVTVLFSALTCIGQEKKYSAPLTLSLIKDKDFLNVVNKRSQKEKDIILIEASKILRDEIHTVTDNKHKHFVSDDFRDVDPVIDFMLALDPINGHAIYFRGEVYRLMNDQDRFLQYFRKYLYTEDSLGSGLPKVTNARLCYETVRGYCDPRTAWISQLLANYYYRMGTREADTIKKTALFDTARINVENVRTHFPAGFDSSSVTMSTLRLETNLKTMKYNHRKQ